MKGAALLGLVVLLAATARAPAWAGPGQQPGASGSLQPISQEKWQAAKENAERCAREGKYVEALQYYLEYTRQAEGLGRPGLVAWGKNNSAYMIIRMHSEDATVDLAPAKRMLEEGLAISEATEECRKRLAMNLEYVRSFLRSPR
jgi:hypothetical protein